MTSLMEGVAEGVTGIMTALGSVVSGVFGNANLAALVGLGIAFAIVGLGLSLVPRFRR